MGGFYSGPVVGYLFAKSCRREPFMVIDFKGAHYPKAVIVGVVAWITDISERALPETDFMRYARSRGGQVRSYG